MSIRFKHLTAVWVALVLCLCSQQAAAEQCDCNLCPDMCGEWEVGAHALYFAPITCPYAYANTYTDVQQGPVNVQNGRALIVPCSADWGFRLFGNYINDCLFMGLSYQWLDVTTTHTVTSTDNVIIQGGSASAPGTAIGQIGTGYQNVDIRVGKYLSRGCSSTLYLYGNARWTDLFQRRDTRLVSSDGSFENTQEKSQLEGGAIGVGFGGEFDVWCNFGAFIDGNILGVIGKQSIRDVRYRRLSGTSVVQAREAYPSEVCVVPEVDFRIGINYTYECGCWKVVGELGYEVDYFWQASVLPTLTNVQTAGSLGNFVPVCEDIGFSGLFFGGRFIF